MKRSSELAFTLVEMLTVMAIIAILTGLVIATAGFVQNKAARERAVGEIHEMSSGCESYKTDNGGYPQTGKTDDLDPRIHGNPVTGRDYKDASLALYSALSGDYEPDQMPDGNPEKKGYIQFLPNRLNTIKDGSGKVLTIQYIQDPFGNSYGYSTAGLKQEIDYREELKANPAAPRKPDQAKGYNSTFDMWSTAGQVSKDLKADTNSNKWVRNWGT
jgi:prepilin-type N-terminal cleavage/methylation domain-containing protein